MDGDYPCHWTHDHPRHEWIPILSDPYDPQVLYLDATNMVWCPGKGLGVWSNYEPPMEPV